MIDGVTNADAIPVLERALQFAGQRHRLILHNLANISTPDFQPRDLSVESFREHLGEAVDARRAESGDRGGALTVRDTDEVSFREDRLVVEPQPMGENLMFHDGNDRNVERIVQGLVENFMAFRTASDLLRSRFDLINTAIRERI